MGSFDPSRGGLRWVAAAGKELQALSPARVFSDAESGFEADLTVSDVDDG